MIGIVTLNPCVDKTLFLPKLPAEGIHTADQVTCLAGGNGNNVSRVLRALGSDHRSLVMIAGETGDHIRRLLTEEGLPVRYVTVPGLSRTVTTLVDADYRQVAVKEKGPQLTAGQIKPVKEAFLDFLGGIDLLCIATSIPCPSLIDFPRWAVETARSRGIPALVDTSGPALTDVIKAAPCYLKPNREELADLWSLPSSSAPAEADAVRRMVAMGISHPILSLGERGALAGEEGRVLRVIPPVVQTVNPVGSGDSFVAGLLYGISRGMDYPDCLRWAAAAGAANAARWEAACIGRGDIEPLVTKVAVTPIDES